MSAPEQFAEFLGQIETVLVPRLTKQYDPKKPWSSEDERLDADLLVAAIDGLAAIRTDFETLEKAHGCCFPAGFVDRVAALEAALEKRAEEPVGPMILPGVIYPHFLGRAIPRPNRRLQ